jgi:hypothetical protein
MRKAQVLPASLKTSAATPVRNRDLCMTETQVKTSVDVCA